jgi:hypothetical protein
MFIFSGTCAKIAQVQVYQKVNSEFQTNNQFPTMG